MPPVCDVFLCTQVGQVMVEQVPVYSSHIWEGHEDSLSLAFRSTGLQTKTVGFYAMDRHVLLAQPICVFGVCNLFASLRLENDTVSHPCWFGPIQWMDEMLHQWWMKPPTGAGLDLCIQCIILFHEFSCFHGLVPLAILGLSTPISDGD